MVPGVVLDRVVDRVEVGGAGAVEVEEAKQPVVCGAVTRDRRTDPRDTGKGLAYAGPTATIAQRRPDARRRDDAAAAAGRVDAIDRREHQDRQVSEDGGPDRADRCLRPLPDPLRAQAEEEQRDEEEERIQLRRD